VAERSASGHLVAFVEQFVGRPDGGAWPAIPYRFRPSNVVMIHSWRMTTYALVHGAWHGAWCWELVTPLLQQAGHDVVAPDLPCDDGSATTFDTYADVICVALDGCTDDVVVVGHSLGGATAALVAAKRPVRRLVYLCAFPPEDGRSLFEQWQSEPDSINPDWDKGLSEPDAQLRTTWVDLDIARALFYADCDEQTVTAAFNRLRPQSAYPFTAPCSLRELPSPSCTYVVCTDDQMINPEWSRRIAHRIGAEIVELPGSHSPLLSRPSAVADVLLQLASGMWS
jgi:pimeloyl-ACP methyl ester carboxylesterase